MTQEEKELHLLELYPSIMTDEETEAHLLELYPPVEAVEPDVEELKRIPALKNVHVGASSP